MKKFRGFTLTELMVALAVIGILTAVVTPAVMKIKPNKNKMMIKKAYYTTENIVSSLINNQLYYPDMSDVVGGDDAIYPSIGFDYTEKVIDIDGEEYGTTESKKFCELFESKLNVQREIGSTCTDGFTTTDGMTWYIPEWTQGDTTDKTITVDVNGADKEPNCNQTDTGCSTDNFDRFRIEVKVDGRMKINDADTKAIEYISINASVSKD